MKINKELFFPIVATVALAVVLFSNFYDHSEKPNIDRLVCTTKQNQTYASDWLPKKCEICGWKREGDTGDFVRDNAYHNTALGETCVIEAVKDNYEGQTLE